MKIKGDKLIITLAEHGCTVSEICYYTKRPETSVRRILSAYGVEPAKMWDKVNRRVADLRSRGLNTSEIGRELGLGRATVRAHLKDMGADGLQNKSRVCPVCGRQFEAVTVKQVYCSTKCAEDVHHRTRDKRMSEANTRDKGISLRAVCERDGGHCYICGSLVDWDDYTLEKGKKVVHSKYPSVDHVRPISKGGLHSWDNVRLAHFGCNSRKFNNIAN